MKSQRIKSFTLIEMVLAMLFAAIVVGMAYTSITIFSRLYERYRLSRSADADLQLINQAITRDFYSSPLIELVDKQIILKDSSGLVYIYYSVGENYLFRTAALKTDSIKMDKLAFTCSFEGHLTEKGIIDQVVLGFNNDELPTIFSIRKQYSAAELFGYEESLKQLSSAPIWKP